MKVKVVLEEELWIVLAPNQIATLGRPWVVCDGRGAAGLCPWPLLVLHKGEEVDVEVDQVKRAEEPEPETA